MLAILIGYVKLAITIIGTDIWSQNFSQLVLAVVETLTEIATPSNQKLVMRHEFRS